VAMARGGLIVSLMLLASMGAGFSWQLPAAYNLLSRRRMMVREPHRAAGLCLATRLSNLRLRMMGSGPGGEAAEGNQDDGIIFNDIGNEDEELFTGGSRGSKFSEMEAEIDVSQVLWSGDDVEDERPDTDAEQRANSERQSAIMQQLGTGTVKRGEDKAKADPTPPAEAQEESLPAASSIGPYTFEGDVQAAAGLLDTLIDDGSLESPSMFVNPEAALDSHMTVRVDPIDGAPVRERFAYVDEKTCIGCTHCAMVARNTFFIDPLFGKARAFQQDVDSESKIAEAISTCPVDCIYWVDYEDLATLEKERSGLDNGIMDAGIVGTANKEKNPASKAKVMNTGKFRCESCPARGCRDCPLFGVGENPEYIARREARKARRDMLGGSSDDE